MGRVGADFFESLESTNIECAGSSGEKTGSFGNGGSGSFFALGRNNRGAAFTFGFGLFGHSTLHVGWEFDVLEFNIFDIDAPFVGLSVNNFANLGRDFVAFAEDFVEIKITSHITEGGLRKRAGGVSVIGGLKDGFGRVNNTEINNCIDIDGNIVARDDFLFGNVHRCSADIDFGHVVDIGNNNTETRV